MNRPEPEPRTLSPDAAAPPRVWLTFPNLFTGLRIVLAPFAVWAIAERQYLPALALFAVAAVTDGLDGWLARRLGCVSRAGAYLDPIADKLLLSAVYLALGFTRLAPWWLVGLVFGRDLLILAVAGVALAAGARRDFPPSLWGKISTLLQIVAATLLLSGAGMPGGFLESAAQVSVWLAAAATIWSGLHYLWRALHYTD